jgi:hypothetical protein
MKIGVEEKLGTVKTYDINRIQNKRSYHDHEVGHDPKNEIKKNLTFPAVFPAEVMTSYDGEIHDRSNLTMISESGERISVSAEAGKKVKMRNEEMELTVFEVEAISVA